MRRRTRALGWLFVAIVAVNAATAVCDGWGSNGAVMPCCLTLTAESHGPTVDPCCAVREQRTQSEPASIAVAVPADAPDLTSSLCAAPQLAAHWPPDTSPRHRGAPPDTRLLLSVFLI